LIKYDSIVSYDSASKQKQCKELFDARSKIFVEREEDNKNASLGVEQL